MTEKATATFWWNSCYIQHLHIFGNDAVEQEHFPYFVQTHKI